MLLLIRWSEERFLQKPHWIRDMNEGREKDRRISGARAFQTEGRSDIRTLMWEQAFSFRDQHRGQCGLNTVSHGEGSRS